MTSEKKEAEKRLVEAQSSLERIVPKFCTSINVALLNNNKNVILTMVYADIQGDREYATLIERVIIDVEHAASLRGVLDQMLEDAEYVPAEK